MERLAEEALGIGLFRSNQCKMAPRWKRLAVLDCRRLPLGGMMRHQAHSGNYRDPDRVSFLQHEPESRTKSNEPNKAVIRARLLLLLLDAALCVWKRPIRQELVELV